MISMISMRICRLHLRAKEHYAFRNTDTLIDKACYPRIAFEKRNKNPIKESEETDVGVIGIIVSRCRYERRR